MYVYSWFIVLRESLLTVRLAVSEIKPVQSLTDGQTDGQINYSNSRCACTRGLITHDMVRNVYSTPEKEKGKKEKGKGKKEKGKGEKKEP